MAAFNFPNSPSTNDLHTENSVTWKWDGVMWNRVGPAYTDTTNLNVTGIGTFAGAVNIAGVLTYEDVKNVDSVGIITARTGLSVTAGDVVIPDSIIHNGDTNTKIRFPADDTVTVETNGSERFRITSTGKVGINQASPQTGLHINQDWVTSYGSISAEGSANALVGLGLRSNGNYRASIIWRDGSSGNYMDLATYGGAYPILFRPNGTERLRIDSSGKVSLGTGTARQLLHIHEDSTGACNLVFTNTTTGTAAGDGFIIGLGGGGDPNGQIWHQEAKAIRFGTSDTYRWQIRSNGHLESNNTNLYLLRSGTTGDNDICFGDSADDDIGRIRYDNDNDSLQFLVNTAERLRITSGGQVRIANTDLTTSNKADNLIVGTTSGHTGITIFSGTGETGNIYFGDTDTSGVANRMGTITYDHSGNYMRFSTSGNEERLRIDSTGQTYFKETVGIRTDNVTRANLANPVGAGHSLVGMYIGDGSLLFNNTLNRTGGYYISTETNALNAGPVTLDANMKVDGAWVIV